MTREPGKQRACWFVGESTAQQAMSRAVRQPTKPQRCVKRPRELERSKKVLEKRLSVRDERGKHTPPSAPIRDAQALTRELEVALQDHRRARIQRVGHRRLARLPHQAVLMQVERAQ